MLLAEAASQEVRQHLTLPSALGGAVAVINISEESFIGGVHVTDPSRVAGNTSVFDCALSGAEERLRS